MKRITTLLVVAIMTATNLMAQTMTQQVTGSAASLVEEISDRLALKNLVDTFSVLADIKDIDSQVMLFTEDGVVDSYRGEQLMSHIVGREQLNERFSGFLSLFDTVYHQNGQQTVNINGDTATGTAYCQVVLIGKNREGVRTMTTQGVIYKDEYQRVDGRWLIKHRTSNFTWTTTQEYK